MDYPFFITWSKQRDADTLPLKSAEQVILTLEDGSKVCDLLSTSFHAAFGYSNEPIKNAIKAQLDDIAVANPKAIFAQKITQTKRLLEYLQVDSGKIFYTVSGAEAMENAIKIARHVSKKNYVLARRHSYHGATLGALSITGDWRQKDHHIDQYTIRIPEPQDDPDFSKTEKIILTAGPDKIAALCLETITAMNGVIIPAGEWWQGIQAICRKYQIYLILDEVSCGFGRTGKAFGFHHYQLKPDFICMAKVITGGYVPFGAVWVSPRVSRYYDEQVLSCGLTNYAHPLGLAAMGAVLDQLTDDDFCRHLKIISKLFHQELESLTSLSSVSEIRKLGLLAAIAYQNPHHIDWQTAIDKGVHLACKDGTLVLAPPYVIEEFQLKEAMAMVKSLLANSVVL